MRLVIDPGVLVSALISPLGPPAELWQAIRAGRAQLVASPRLLSELAGVLEREKFRRYVELDEVHRFVAEVSDLADSRSDPDPGAPITRDPDDDFLVALAQVARVDAIVSGDGDLTEMTDLDPPVLTPRQVLEGLERKRPGEPSGC